LAQNSLNELAKETFLREINELADEQGVTTDTAFSRWICKEFLRLEDDDDIETAVEIGGSNDRAVDFFWIDDEPAEREAQSINWGQAKFSETLDRVFDSDALDHFVQSIGRLEDSPVESNSAFKNASEEFRAVGGVDSQIQKRMYLCVAGSINAQVEEDISPGSDWRQRNLSTTTGPSIEIIVIDLNKIIQQCVQRQTGPVQITFSNEAKKPDGTMVQVSSIVNRIDSVTGRPSIFGYVNADELLKLKRSEADTLFAQNVRQGLGTNTSPNKKMVKTLQDDVDKQKFWKYNNGITAICDKLEKVEGVNNKYKITNINIVNGRQTTLCLEENHGYVDDNVLVGLTIHEAEDEDERNKISQATNNQNPVNPLDLITNQDELRILESDCNTNHRNWFFERQRGGFDYNPTTRKDRTRITPRRRMKKGDVSRAYYAFYENAFDAIKIADSKMYDADDPVYYNKIFDNRSIEDFMFVHIFTESIKSLLKTWKNQIVQNKEQQPMEFQEVWHDELTPTYKEILRKKQIQYVLLNWISDTFKSFPNRNQNDIKTKMIADFGALDKPTPIPNEFIHIINAAFTNFMYIFNMNRNTTWELDPANPGQLRMPSPPVLKKKIADQKDSKALIKMLLDAKADQIAQAKASGAAILDPIKPRFEFFLNASP